MSYFGSGAIKLSQIIVNYMLRNFLGSLLLLCLKYNLLKHPSFSNGLNLSYIMVAQDLLALICQPELVVTSTATRTFTGNDAATDKSLFNIPG